MRQQRATSYLKKLDYVFRQVWPSDRFATTEPEAYLNRSCFFWKLRSMSQGANFI